MEIHGANGYLIDQFLRDGSNKRNDIYGGHTEHRARFMKEVTQAVVDEIGADRTGIRLTAMNLPWIEDAYLEGVMIHAAAVLDKFKPAFLHVRETASACVITPMMRKVYKGVLIGNDSYDGASAQAALDNGIVDAVAFGSKFIANPDLPARLRAGAALNLPNPPSFYKGGAEGYTDYPFMSAKAA